MIFRILALFVVALALNSILRRVFHALSGSKAPRSRASRAGTGRRGGGRRWPGRAEPADFEVIEDDRKP